MRLQKAMNQTKYYRVFINIWSKVDANISFLCYLRDKLSLSGQNLLWDIWQFISNSWAKLQAIFLISHVQDTVILSSFGYNSYVFHPIYLWRVSYDRYWCAESKTDQDYQNSYKNCLATSKTMQWTHKVILILPTFQKFLPISWMKNIGVIAKIRQW